MSQEFRRDRVGIPGSLPAAAITGAEWTDTRTRLTAVELQSAAVNPYRRTNNAYLSTQSHGLGGSVIDIALPAEEIVWTPIFLPFGFTSTSMAVRVTVAQPGAVIQLGLYNASGTLQQDFGTANADTVGWKHLEIATGTVVSAGENALCVHLNNTAGVQIRGLTNALALYHSATTLGTYFGFRGTRTFGSLPAAIESLGATGNAPMLAIRNT
jgi:hypothetical protein